MQTSNKSLTESNSALSASNKELLLSVSDLRSSLLREREDRDVELLQWQDNFKTVVKEAQSIARTAGECLSRDERGLGGGEGNVLREGGEVMNILDKVSNTWKDK